MFHIFDSSTVYDVEEDVRDGPKRTADAQQREADTQPTGPSGKNPTDRVLNTRGARRTDKEKDGKG